MFKHLTAPCPIDDYSDLRPIRLARNRLEPGLKRNDYPGRQLPPMAKHPAHPCRLTLNRDRRIMRPLRIDHLRMKTPLWTKNQRGAYAARSLLQAAPPPIGDGERTCPERRAHQRPSMPDCPELRAVPVCLFIEDAVRPEVATAGAVKRLPEIGRPARTDRL